MASTATDVIDKLAALAVLRGDYEWAWNQVAKVAAPDAGRFVVNAGTSLAMATRRSKDIYDSTAVAAVDRLASGLEGLIMSPSEYWHGLGVTDLTKEDETDEEKRWLERTRNLLFKVRYDADSGWITASQTCLRRMVAFGNAFMYVEEGNTGHDSTDLIRYRHIPLNECYVDVNHQGVVDTFYRRYKLTARQAMQKYGERCPAMIKKAAESTTDSHTKFDFIQCISPRGDYGAATDGVLKAPWRSLHVAVEAKTIVRESGYYEFPIVDFRWLPDDIYGEGPVMKALADIQSLNTMAKNELVAGQQAIDPPLLLPNNGVMNRPNTNPGAVNIGGMTAQGQELIKPLFTGQRLDFATAVLEAKRMQVKDSMYLTLFQILTQNNPQMTATEALIKADEKATLLGPAGTRIHQSMSGMVEREMGILGRKGLYAKNSAYVPPRSLRNNDVGAKFTNMLSRQMRAKEGQATINMLNILAPLSQADPSVVDSIDGDETTRGLAEILGVPMKFLRKREDVAQMRADRAQQQQYAQNAATAKDAAAASKAGVDALTSLQNAGAL